MDVLKGRGTGKGRLTNMKLIVAINFVAGLGIFFSGYDQGVMAGVNVSPDYLVCMLSCNPEDASMLNLPSMS